MLPLRALLCATIVPSCCVLSLLRGLLFRVVPVAISVLLSAEWPVARYPVLLLSVRRLLRATMLCLLLLVAIVSCLLLLAVAPVRAPSVAASVSCCCFC